AREIARTSASGANRDAAQVRVRQGKILERAQEAVIRQVDLRAGAKRLLGNDLLPEAPLEVDEVRCLDRPRRLAKTRPEPAGVDRARREHAMREPFGSEDLLDHVEVALAQKPALERRSQSGAARDLIEKIRTEETAPRAREFFSGWRVEVQAIAERASLLEGSVRLREKATAHFDELGL